MTEMPMFPLGTTLLPGMALPLRLFEQRYLQMYADIIDADRQFGVVLIERGIESRDDNPTFDTGCIAYIVGSGVSDDGTLALVAIGRKRIRIDDWLPSDPYPRAMVTPLDDDPLTETGMSSLQSAADQLPGLLAMAAELNPDFEAAAPGLSDDPMQAVYQLAQLAGLQTFDMQKVLEAHTSDERAAVVDRLLTETVELIRMQLEIG
jgi:Lon protease-like protein